MAPSQIRHLSLALPLPLSPSPSLSLEFVLHFVILRACHPYPMPEVQHHSHPHSGVDFSEFAGTWDIPFQCHGKKRRNTKQKDSCKNICHIYNVVVSNCSCFSLLSKALRWICLIQELFLLRESLFVLSIRCWHATPVQAPWTACLLLDTRRARPPNILLPWKSGDSSRILCVLAVGSCRKVNNQLSIDFL